MKKKYFRQLVFHTFFVSTLFGCSWFRPSPEKLFEKAKMEGPFDVIIVPGVPYNGVRWDTTMKGRIIWANFLIQKGYAKNVIFSGGAVYSPYVESKVFSLYSQALGMSKDKIFIEEKAQHTTENVYYSYLIAKKNGFQKVAVATDSYQSPRTMGFTKRHIKEKIYFVPFIVDTLKLINGVNPIIDATSAYVKDFRSIRETQTKWHRWMGTLGKNIVYEK